MWCKHEKLHLNLSSMYISANTIKHHGNQDIEQTMLVLSLLLNFGLCLPVSGRQSPNTQIMIYRLDTTSLVIVVLDRMSCFGRTILISAESRIFLPKYDYFGISAESCIWARKLIPPGKPEEYSAELFRRIITRSNTTMENGNDDWLC